MSNTPVDMICFNQYCIRNKSQLFFYESQQRTIHANHDDDCINIHPHNFKKKYANQTSLIQEIKTKYESSLQDSVNQIIRRVSQVLRSMLSKQIGNIYDKNLEEFNVFSCQNLLDKIKNTQNSEYQLMILTNLFLEDTNGLKHNIIKKMQNCQEGLINHFKQLNTHINSQLQKIISQFQPKLQQFNKNSSQIEVELPSQDPIKIQIQENQQIMSIQKLKPTSNDFQSIQKRIENIENNKNLQNMSESIELSDIRKYFKPNKTKQIKKTNNFQKVDRMLNLFDNNSSQHYQSQTFSMNNSPSKIGTLTIRNQTDLIQIQTKQSNFQKLVIYYPLPQQNLLKVIRKVSPKQIFLNYAIKLSSEFIQKIPEQISKQITRFQEFWDHDEFFDERINRQYFPIDDFRHIKSVNKLHLTSKHLNCLPKLSNIWISNQFDLQQLKSSKKRISEIESLRIQLCKCCNNLNQHVLSQILGCFKQVSSLKTFVIKCQVLNSHNKHLLKQLTQNNKRIQCIAAQIQGKYIPRKILQCFSHLPLTKLSINNEHNNNRLNVYMDVTPITKIKSLRKLAMTNMFFTTQENQIKQSQYVELDEEASTKISSLSELIFIDLFRCSPIYPVVVSSLPEKAKHNLYHLNLSHTLMDNILIPQLSFLPKLKQLNLDRTILVLKDLFKELAKKPLLSITRLSLFHYNGDHLDEVDQIQDFACHIQFSELNNQQIERISNCFPNLEYLNIAFCRYFTELPQHKFKKLKYLCSNKEYMSPAKIEKLKYQRGIQVYLYDGKYQAWVVPLSEKK